MTYDEFDITLARRLARARQPLSPLRQSEGRLRTFAIDVGPGAFAPPQVSGYAQLVTVRRGAALLHCSGVRVVVTPTHAAWVPERMPYALELRTRCELRILYADSNDYARAFAPVRTSALLAELIERAAVAGYLNPADARDARLLAVIDDELAALTQESAAHALVAPLDPRLLAAVNRVLDTSEELPSSGELASLACMSVRTFERRFRRETGLTPQQWLRRARLCGAALALAAGASVTEAALGCGYASLSAFVAAYRTLFGVTPGRALRKACGVPSDDKSAFR